MNQKGVAGYFLLIFISLLILIPGSLYLFKQSRQNNLPIPSFSSGRIAFVKNDNVYVAEKSGEVTQLTSDATESISTTFNHSIKYRFPIWSPQGDKFSFTQVFDYGDKAYIFISDGKSVSSKNSDMLGAYWHLPPFWYTNNKITIPEEAITTSKLEGIEWSGTNGEDSPYFSSFSKSDGCGGGGRPDWSTKLSWNHFGSSDGVRATFVYLKDSKTAIYSTGCENQNVEVVTMDGNTFPFDQTRKEPQEFVGVHHNNKPQQLQLSPNGDSLVGTLNGDVVLYDFYGNLTKTLTNSSKAYGPVFSKDGNTIFYADNFADKPSLSRVSKDGANPKVLYTSGVVGAISNISLSPDDKQAIFTLIQQEEPTDTENGIYPQAHQDLYLVNSDGTNLKLFLNDASQGSWSPK